MPERLCIWHHAMLTVYVHHSRLTLKVMFYFSESEDNLLQRETGFSDHEFVLEEILMEKCRKLIQGAMLKNIITQMNQRVLRATIYHSIIRKLLIMIYKLQM